MFDIIRHFCLVDALRLQNHKTVLYPSHDAEIKTEAEKYYNLLLH